jgi:hypothetical protein
MALRTHRLNSDVQSFVGLLALALILALVMLAGLMAIPVGIGGAIFYGYWYYKNSPKAKEEQAQKITQEMYDRAITFAPPDRDALEGAFEQVFDDKMVAEVGLELFDMEDFTPPPKPPPYANNIEGARYRDQLTAYIANAHDKEVFNDFLQEIGSILRPFVRTHTGDGMFTTFVTRSAGEIERLIVSFYGEDRFFRTLRRKLDANYAEQKDKYPTDYTGNNLCWDYLKNTPLLFLEFKQSYVDIEDPMEHVHILGGSGSGKTILLSYIIAEKLKEDCCIIVIDSQTQLIDQLARLDYPPEELGWITPKHSLAINLFDVNFDEIKDDEALMNNTISLLEYVLEGLMNTPLTPRQRNLFQYATQLLITIEGANVLSLMQLLEDHGPFDSYIEKCDGTIKRFFLKDFGSKTYKQPREELRYRLDTLLRNRTFRRIFSARENRLDMYTQMDKARLMLMDTNQHLLADGSGILGRLYIAMLLQASYKRVADGRPHKPVYLFVDEAHEYFDHKLEQMLVQARKAGIGVFLSHQNLSQTDKSGITGTVMVNTATKFVHTPYRKDAAAMASSMRTTPEEVLNLSKYDFMMFQPSTGATPVSAPSNPLNSLPKSDDFHERRVIMETYFGPNDGDFSTETSDEETHDERQQRHQGALKKIPKHLKSLYSSDEAMEFSKVIKSTYDLDGDQYNHYLDISGDLALGFFPASDLKQKLQDALGLEPDVAQAMYDDIVWNFDDLIQYHGLTSNGDNSGPDDNPMMGEEDGEQ